MWKWISAWFLRRRRCIRCGEVVTEPFADHRRFCFQCLRRDTEHRIAAARRYLGRGVDGIRGRTDYRGQPPTGGSGTAPASL